jgi:mucin-19
MTTNTGRLSTSVEYIGGSGTFTQSDGIHTISDGLSISRGRYVLNGTGQLSTDAEQIYQNGLFQQSGGTHTASAVYIASDGQFQLSGGTLNIDGINLDNRGIFDGCGATASLNAKNCIVDLCNGQLKNVGSMSVSMGDNSLLIVPPGFDPSTAFRSFSSSGLTHTAGTKLTVNAGQRFQGLGAINDPVNCQGRIYAAPATFFTGSAISLNNGLVLSTGGYVFMGMGTLIVNDTISGISGGSLSSSGGHQIVGKNGSGLFTQSGGSSYLYDLTLGYNAGDNGTYDLSGGQLSGSQYIGRAGTGTFTQTGGSNTGSSLTLGSSHGNGTYNLNGGTLALSSLSKGSGTASFNFGGGTLSGWGTLSTALPMRLTGTNGTAKVDTTGGPVTLSGQLSGPGRLTKLGKNTLTLSGDNSYTGGTTISAGTLRLGSAGAIGSSGTITFGGGTLQFSDSNTTDYSSRFSTASNQAYNIDTSQSSGSVTLAAPLTSSGGTLAKTGSGTLTLSGINTYGGLTTVSAGKLELNATGGNAIAGDLTISGGTVKLLQAHQMASDKTLVVGGGTFDLQGYNQSAAHVRMTGGSIIGSGGTLTSATDYDVQFGTISAILGGSVGLNKTSSGTVTLTGANTYTGTTTIGSGTLALGANNALPTGSSVVLGGGKLATDGFSQTNVLGGLTLTADSTIDMGALGSSVLDFADSHSVSWSGTLAIANWNGSMAGGGADELIFGSSSSGLTLSQLGEIVFSNPNGLSSDYGATILPTGEVVPGAMLSPEPSDIAILTSGAFLLVGFALRRRRRHVVAA